MLSNSVDKPWRRNLFLFIKESKNLGWTETKNMLLVIYKVQRQQNIVAKNSQWPYHHREGFKNTKIVERKARRKNGKSQ